MILHGAGRHRRVEAAAVEMIPVFESRDDHKKALAAFLLFQKAAEAESVTLGLIRETVTSLEQARRIRERG